MVTDKDEYIIIKEVFWDGDDYGVGGSDNWKEGLCVYGTTIRALTKSFIGIFDPRLYNTKETPWRYISQEDISQYDLDINKPDELKWKLTGGKFYRFANKFEPCNNQQTKKQYMYNPVVRNNNLLDLGIF